MDNWLYSSWVYENSCTKLTKLKCSEFCWEGSTFFFLSLPPFLVYFYFSYYISSYHIFKLVNQFCTEVILLMNGTCGGKKSAFFPLFKPHPYPIQLHKRAKLLGMNKSKEDTSNLGFSLDICLPCTRYQRYRVIIYPQSQHKILACACSIWSLLTWVHHKGSTVNWKVREVSPSS